MVVICGKRSVKLAAARNCTYCAKLGVFILVLGQLIVPFPSLPKQIVAKVKRTAHCYSQFQLMVLSLQTPRHEVQTETDKLVQPIKVALNS